MDLLIYRDRRLTHSNRSISGVVDLRLFRCKVAAHQFHTRKPIILLSKKRKKKCILLCARETESGRTERKKVITKKRISRGLPRRVYRASSYDYDCARRNHAMVGHKILFREFRVYRSATTRQAIDNSRSVEF